ncbi:MAG: helix-turn-helix domain-containing protein [Chitinophagaceae bacterium]
MENVQMLFPMEPAEFWRYLKTIIEEEMEQKISSISKQTFAENPPQKKLLKAKEVCELFQVSKPTIYEWLKQGKLKSIKIESRRYFLWQDIEELIRNSKSLPILQEKFLSDFIFTSIHFVSHKN